MTVSRLLLFAPLAALTAVPTVAPITFEDIAERAGVHFITNSNMTPQKHQPEFMVAGVAIFDYDGDGYPDLYFVNGADMPTLEKKGPQHMNRLFHNNHDLTFTDVTEKAGVGSSGYGMGVAIGDYDNDGRPDIYVVNVNGNVLYHNNGDGTFTDVTAKARVGGGMHDGKKMWSVSAAWLDYNNDGLLDLFVSNYCVWDPETEKPCIVNGVRTGCNPRMYAPLPNTLFRNNGDGTFTDVSDETGISKSVGRGMGVAVADFDNDGWPDVIVANDNSTNQLFHNIGGKKFEEVGDDAGVAMAEGGNVISGMGVDFKDTSNKGLPDIWMTAQEKQTFPLFRNKGKSLFIDGTAISGLGLETSDMSGWSNGIVDLDNDGWKDLWVARSNVLDNVAVFYPRTFEEPVSIFRNLGTGRFRNVTDTAGADVQKPEAHRGGAHGDLDNDGRMDLVISVLNGQMRILHNTTKTSNHWLLLQLKGTRSNRMGLGARVRLTTPDGLVQYSHASTSTGYASSSDPRVHFGLGASATAKEIQILWPSGVKQILTSVAVDRVLAVTEPSK
jgi:enediyne biosynthesis protein E4